jgi:tetratricopeptide (TPR) repeat protein
MLSRSGSIRKTVFLAFIFAGMTLVCPIGYVQAQDPPQYSVEEYNAYQAITAEPDPAKKVEMIAGFFKTYPKSTLKTHVVGDFQGALKTLQDGKKWQQIITVGKQFLTVIPDDDYAIALVTAAYEETKNYGPLAAFGEECYKTKPSKELAYTIARAYRGANNNAKLLQWAEKVVAQDPNNYEMLFELARGYGDMERNAEAEKYSKQCLKVIQSAARPEGTSESTWNNYTSQIQMACYFIIGNAAFKRSDYANAIPNLEGSLKINPRNGPAHYFLAQSYWQTQKTDLAMRSFAKAFLLGGQTATPAKANLDNLWKQTHRGLLTGEDQFIAAMKAEIK